MPLSADQKHNIKALLSKKINDKLKRYSRESGSMPFLTRLIKDNEKVAAYSFIHSVATSLGMSIYEDVSKLVAQESCVECFSHYDIGGVLSREQRFAIDDVIRKLRNGEVKVNHEEEVDLILKASAEEGRVKKEGRIADFYMVRDGMEHYFEIKTPKPNIDVFTKSKEKLLEWVARKRKAVKVFLAFPYNPCHPLPYERFTIQGVLERGKEFLVGEEYWNFLGSQDTFNQLLELFDEIGEQFKDNIQSKIQIVAREKMGV